MLEIAAAVKAAETLYKAVGVIEKLIGNLSAKPDVAAQKLAQALGEVAKTLQAVENATSKFLRAHPGSIDSSRNGLPGQSS